MARPTTPLGSSRLILTLAVMVCLSFGAAVLAPATEENETTSGSLLLQAVGSDEPTSPTTTAPEIATAQEDAPLPKVQLPANPRETRDDGALGAATTTLARTVGPTSTTTAAMSTAVKSGALEPRASGPRALVEDVADVPLTPLPPPPTTTTVPLPEPAAPTTLVQISDEPAFDPQRCEVQLTDDKSAQLTWSGATAPNGYEIRRNNVVVGSALITETSFTDSTLSKTGVEYHFSVSATGSGAKTWCGFVVVPVRAG